MEFFTNATRRSIQTCYKMGSFVCKHFHPNWFRVVFQFCDRHMWNVLIDEQHNPATMDISVFSIYIIWASFREEFWSCNRAVDFGFLNSYNMWLMKVKESQQFQFFCLLYSIRDQISPCRKIGQGQPRVIIWTKLVVLEYPILHIKFQGHRPFGSGEEDFLRFLTYMGMAAILAMWPGPFE